MMSDKFDCADTGELVSRALDGELDAQEAARLAAHVAGCAACRRVQDEMAAMVGALATLEPPAPRDAEALWRHIDAAATPVVPIARARRWRRVAKVAVPVAAAAAVVIAVGVRRPSRVVDEALLRDAAGELAQAEGHYRRAVEDLERIAGGERGSWSEAERTRFDAGLAALQHTTAADRALATARPADAEVAARLFGDYEKEIAYLEDAVLRPAPSPPAGGPR